MNIGNRLKKIRTLKNYSVYKLAQLSGVSSTYIHEIESGKKQPTVEIISKLCKSLDITLSEFFIENSLNLKEKITIEEVSKDLKNLTPEQLELLSKFLKTLK